MNKRSCIVQLKIFLKENIQKKKGQNKNKKTVSELLKKLLSLV